ncbi:MAG: helix-turn-helix transcriptional regulator [Hymenobacteraceae bacterium]|nr:helix-turn-helix transcriptional regulator [Hymenobacteraceae bacterium]MDX5395106.1 helix-turn-helix transcriptional regulator [Hymenobacteraceae bacterium]MDX5444101.1 helix-turn-helix transcriptional regulator [Hymenobacteraceae bacterium]MDX5511144.1 helix-turn-helix transcriptional regulator [Hymenobacteraceae bacterium]
MREEIEKAIAQIAAVSDNLPGVVIIHNVETDSVEYMSDRGLLNLEISLEELKRLGSEYHRRFFNPEDAADYVPKLFDLMARNDDQEIFTFFQQVRPSEVHDWSWYFSSVKILLRNKDGNPLLCITMAYPIDPHHHITTKVSRLLEENNFLRKHYNLYTKLTNREREVLRLLASGNSSPEIAKELNISAATVDTHRRNLKVKLKAHTVFDLIQFARAFDLV